MTPQGLITVAARHQVLLEGLKSGMVKDFDKVFSKTDALIRQILRALDTDKISDLTRKQLQEVLSEIQSKVGSAYDKQLDDLISKLPGVAEYEAEFQARALNRAFKELDFEAKQPTIDQAYAAAVREPVQATGQPLADVIKGFSTGSVDRINNAVRTGYAQGKTMPELIRAVVGTAPNFADGTTAVSRRHAAVVTRTAVQHVASTARELTYYQNRNLIVGVTWVSTLDSRTSTQCRSLDGHKFELNEGPRPPIHPCCRSTTAPDLSKEFDFLDQGATRSSKDGYVDADLTYYQWLKQQPSSFQDEVIGEKRGKLLRDGGLTEKRFSDLQLDKNFNPLTLEQMRKLEPKAFEEAGI